MPATRNISGAATWWWWLVIAVVVVGAAWWWYSTQARTGVRNRGRGGDNRERPDDH